MDTKEIVASILSLAIVGFAIFCMHQMFNAPANIENNLWQHQSSVLQIAVSLAGAVTGYYFGRIPAERSATVAQQAAVTAQQGMANATAQAGIATQNEQRIRTNLQDLKNELKSPIGGGNSAAEAPQIREAISVRIENILRS